MTPIQNLLLVTYDCARWDVAYSGCLPTLERLRSEGVTCMRALSSAPLTPVSHATVFTGLQPYHHGLQHLFRERLHRRHTTLAQHLNHHGMKTGGVVSCPGLNRWYGFQRGFKYFHDQVPPLPGGEGGLEMVDVQLRGLAMKRAEEVVDLGLRWLARRQPQDRWFLFLHFFDAHWPYEPPYTPTTPRNAYEGELQYSDWQFGRVIEYLRQQGLLDTTLVVVFGDHGEDLDGWYPNDKGGEALGHPEEKGHGCLLYEQTQHVPLVLSHPVLSRRAVEEPVGLVDLFPTLCSLLGVPVPSGLDGLDLSRSFLSDEPPPRRSYYAETRYPEELVDNSGPFSHIRNLQSLWLDNGWKVIRTMDGTQVEAFHLREDPLEHHPLPLAAVPGSVPWPQGSFA